MIPFFKKNVRKLDWRSVHDERSRNYAIRSVLPKRVTPRKVMWEEGVVLDQGSEGACVGFGWTADLLCHPIPPKEQPPTHVAEQFAFDTYRKAKKIDEWPGENYSGTSVLAGAKILKRRGFIGEYRWCFSVKDIRDAIIKEGPVVVGVPWYESMYETAPNGLVNISGRMVGGHCILITGYDPQMDFEDGLGPREVFRWRNSWGPSYGVDGSGYILVSEFEKLIDKVGEACVPMKRSVPEFPVQSFGTMSLRQRVAARWSSLVAHWKK